MISKWSGATDDQVKEAYENARRAYAAVGVDTDAAIAKAAAVAVSVHSWQGDDVTGFEDRARPVDSGGLLATGHYPGRARSADELRRDLEKVMTLAPGVHRVNLHACYAETGGAAVDRDALAPEHFAQWVAWAKHLGIGLDFNPTFFAHPKAADGMTLAHADPAVRNFWVRHAVACRRIGESFGRQLASPCVVNLWIPDGLKDSPADRWGPRRRLLEALGAIYAEDLGIDRRRCVDSVEGKLFGLGSEDYVVGSYEFYSAFALSRGLVLCLDMGHFHPTETVHDKLSALLQFHKRLLLHVSRPIRWDSDHVVVFNDDLRQVFLELARGQALECVYVALDYFDASINRIAAYVLGARATRQAILYGLLDPSAALMDLEASGHGAGKLALMEAAKTLPFGAVWDRLCLREGSPVGLAWMAEVESYERDVLSKRK